MPDETLLLKIVGLYFVDLGELQTRLKGITTGSNLSFRWTIPRAHERQP